MTRTALSLLAIFTVTACADIDNFIAEADAERDAADLSRCEAQGFQPGTEAMALCLERIEASRQASADRAAAATRASQ